MINGPTGGDDEYYYDTQFSNGNLPPGELVGFSGGIFLEIDNNDDNWTTHLNEISPPSG